MPTVASWTTREFNIANAYWLAYFSQATYGNYTQNENVISSFKVERFFNSHETQAYLFGNDETLILAFRGTKESKDLISDINIALVHGPGGKVHEGFWCALSYVWKDILSYLLDNRGKRSLYVTGHSLGGALAVLATAKLRLERDLPVHGLYTFGQPRVGDRDFAKSFDQDFNKQTFRFVNNNDIVPRIPCRTLNYSHVGMFKYFDESGNFNENISWWDMLLDRADGAIHELLRLGFDCIDDHPIRYYVHYLNIAINNK